MVYEWKINSLYKVPAQVAGEKMEQIIRDYGAVTKENFLEASRPEDSETHDLFEWDDSKAAEKYRLHQSNMVINHLTVKIDVEYKDLPVTTRAFVNVQQAGIRANAQFLRIDTALSDDECRTIVLANAIQELREFRRKYEAYSELAQVFDAINSIDLSA